jgi:hypothetical protein
MCQNKNLHYLANLSQFQILTHGEVMVAFQQHWKQKSFITIFHHRIACFQPIKEKTNLKILNLWFNIRNNMI